MIREECPATPAAPVDKEVAINRLMGMAVFGEMVAARIYTLMASLREEYAPLLKKFASMEGQHATWFREACKDNGIVPDKEFADHELDYLIDQVNDHHAAGDFDALALVQGFIVESMAIAVYEPFLEVADQYPGTHAIFKKALDEELYHVDWVTRYLRLRFFDGEDAFMELAQRVNVAGIDCVGGSMMKIADYLSTIGLSGADCAGCMMDGYTQLLERVGIEQKRASKNVIGLFMPLIHKYRHGLTIK